MPEIHHIGANMEEDVEAVILNLKTTNMIVQVIRYTRVEAAF